MECYFVLSLLGRGGEFSQTIDALLVAIFVVLILLIIVFNAVGAMTSLQGPDRFEGKKKYQ